MQRRTPGSPFTLLHVLEVQHLVRSDLPLLNQCFTRDHDKELPLCVMPVLALGNTRVGDIDAELAVTNGFNKLGKGATGIHIGLQRVFFNTRTTGEKG